MNKKKSNKVIDELLGIGIGDAVGVPFEFRSRDMMKSNPEIPPYPTLPASGDQSEEV